MEIFNEYTSLVYQLKNLYSSNFSSYLYHDPNGLINANASFIKVDNVHTFS